MSDDFTRIDTADELERHLLESEWAYITSNPGGARICVICPLCNAMVPPVGGDNPDWKRHHIRYHVEDWRRIEGIERRARSDWP